MRPYQLLRPRSVEMAVEMMAAHLEAQYIAGGTNQIDMMKAGIHRPSHLVDIAGLGLDRISDQGDVIRLGALASNTVLATDPLVLEHVPMVSQTVLEGATQQIRNAATTAGNILQRNRCPYFYVPGTRCNRKNPGSGCDAIGGFDRLNAIFGTSESCIAVMPSDLAIALRAYDARVRVIGPDGMRTIPFADFHRPPGDTPEVETDLRKSELILSVDVPKAGRLASAYHKIRERRSYAFALLSVGGAARLTDGRIAELRLAAGGVGTVPWRLPQVESALIDEAPSQEAFQRAAALSRDGAVIGRQNAFKLPMLERAIVRVLTDITET
ncbi:FAD binding domain-containing protein [Aestuariibius insulae]|uniref:FAD binding domain-containing protein n=1 Tax=Aestuariibius insulae TaxID=2058287 RepID=UPI00345EDB2F